MNENLYIAHKKLPHKTLRVHSARYTQCIHVSSRKLKLPKDTRTKKYKQLLPTHPFPKVQLYTAVECKNIYRVTNNDNRKKNHTHTHTHTHRGPSAYQPNALPLGQTGSRSPSAFCISIIHNQPMGTVSLLLLLQLLLLRTRVRECAG